MQQSEENQKIEQLRKQLEQVVFANDQSSSEKQQLQTRPPDLLIPSLLDTSLGVYLKQQENVYEDYYEFDENIQTNSIPMPNDQSFQSKYLIKQKIGEGNHGMVFKCEHIKKSKMYAVKIMQLDDQRRKNLKKNFLIVRCLRHENILPYKALYLHRGRNICYLVMEYYPYPPLDRKLTYSEQQLKKIVTQILTALKYFHKKKFWHRDIKPENILYNKQDKIVKIIDFGVAKRFQVDQGLKEVVHTVTGTSSYRAPQIFTLNYSQKIDCWALGITIYELVTHCKPFQAFDQKNVSEYIKIVKEQKIVFPEKIWKNYSQHLQDLVKRLLKVNPNHRISASQALRHFWLYTDKNQDQSLQKKQFLIVKKSQGRNMTVSERFKSSDERNNKSLVCMKKVDTDEKKNIERPSITGQILFSEEEQIYEEDY